MWGVLTHREVGERMEDTQTLNCEGSRGEKEGDDLVSCLKMSLHTALFTINPSSFLIHVPVHSFFFTCVSHLAYDQIATTHLHHPSGSHQCQ